MEYFKVLFKSLIQQLGALLLSGLVMLFCFVFVIFIIWNRVT